MSSARGRCRIIPFPSSDSARSVAAHVPGLADAAKIADDCERLRAFARYLVEYYDLEPPPEPGSYFCPATASWQGRYDAALHLLEIVADEDPNRLRAAHGPPVAKDGRPLHLTMLVTAALRLERHG